MCIDTYRCGYMLYEIVERVLQKLPVSYRLHKVTSSPWRVEPEGPDVGGDDL